MTRRWGTPKAWKKAVKVRPVADPWTAGNRPGLARALGFDDEPGATPDHDPNACETFGCEECLRLPNEEAF